MVNPNDILSGAFDRSGALHTPPLMRLPREAWALGFYAPERPNPTTLPNGDGRSVLVIPAFLTHDSFTQGLRAFLGQCGFAAHGINAGINWGPTPRILDALKQRFADLRRSANGPINLIGISMGGLLARDLAFHAPADVAHVITIACPIRLPTATPLEPFIRLLARGYSKELNLTRLAQPLLTPSTSIYSRKDGLVAWESCISHDANCECFEVDAPHIAMARNPEALRIIVERLAAERAAA